MKRHPIWFIVVLVICLAFIGIYQHFGYRNGFDVPKDSGLLGIVGTVMTAFAIWCNGPSKKD